MVLLCGVSAISAASDNAVDNLTSEIGTLDDSISVSNDENTGNDILQNQRDTDNIILTNSSNENMVFDEMYVGQNTTEDGGNGSYENPFATLKLACDNINEGDNVTLNLFNGTYLVNSLLTFKSSNLIINGLGNVVIKNGNPNKPTDYQALSLSFSSNLTINNIVFDQSGVSQNVGRRFYPVYMDPKNTLNATVIYNNCTFIGSTHAPLAGSSEFNLKFIKCIIKNYGRGSNSILFSRNFFNGYTGSDKYYRFAYFENCVFSNMQISKIAQAIVVNKTVNMDGMWFGENQIPDYLLQLKLNENGKQVGLIDMPITKYAIFSVSENYLGNNQFEIIGKLCWNGTNDTVGDAFAPMTVTLTSTTGDIVSNATLENGTFKVVYTSNSSDNKVTAKLDYETIDLTFTNLNMQVDAPSIYYGDDQNITLTLPQVVNATVTVTVNNRTYEVFINNTNSTTYTIEDILTEGDYTVDVLLKDVENHLYASNSTVLSVSKVSDYTFDVVPTTDVKVGDNVTIDITLPGDVNGTVIVKFGNETQTLQANATMTVTFSDLNATTYLINVTYDGNDKYTSKEKTDSVTVNKADSSVEIDDAVFIYGEVIAVPFNMTNAKGVTVIVYNKDDEEVANTSSESNIIKLDTLPAGEYTLEVTTVVDPDNYEWDSKTVKLTINKANSTLIISDKEFTYGEDAIVNVETINSTGDVIATLIDANDKEISVTVSGDNVTLPLLNVGKYTLTVTTNVDGNHNNFTDSAVITIVKATPSMDVIVEPAENITVKDNVTLTVKLPSDATGDVVIKVNGKKLYNVSANETIAINLSNGAGDYVVDVTYSGDKNYESDMSTKEFTISKAETSITANPIIFEEGNSSTIEVNISDVDSGIILVDVADKKFYGDINAGKATVLINGLVAGNYTAKISFAGDEKFKPTADSVAVNVTAAPDIIGELNEIIKAQNSTIESQAKEISSLNETVIAQEGTIKNQTEQISALNETVCS